MKVSCWLNDPTASQDRRLNNESDPKEMHNIFKNDFLEIVTCRVSRYNPEEKGDRTPFDHFFFEGGHTWPSLLLDCPL